jgi:hypothetical protein
MHNGFYSVIKKNKLMLFSGKMDGMDFVMLSEINQNQKDTVCFLSYAEAKLKKKKV